MNKKKLFTLLLSTVLLAGCDINPNQSNASNEVVDKGEAPRFKGYKDLMYDLTDFAFLTTKNSRDELINNTTVSDKEDGDLTSSIVIELYNFYTNEKISIIDLSEHGKYKLVYSVTDSSGNSASEWVYIIVGQPNVYLNEDGTPKEIIDTKYEMDQINATYEVIFEEDFNYTGAPGTVEGEADYNAYTYQTGGGGWGNNEVQIYEKADRTCYVSNGALKISVVKDGATYYSARLNTSNNFSKEWTYGKYEVWAKLPAGNGPWPAIWMMPNDYGYHGTWPKCGEIDIMETSQYYKNYILGTIHNAKYNGSNGLQKGGRAKTDPTIYTSYHKYSVEWLPDKIMFFFDDEKYFTYQPSNFLSSEKDIVTVDIWPFDYSFHFIFNIAMGGNMGGKISDTLFDEYDEIAMYIDKIRVSQSSYVNKKYRGK